MMMRWKKLLVEHHILAVLVQLLPLLQLLFLLLNCQSTHGRNSFMHSLRRKAQDLASVKVGSIFVMILSFFALSVLHFLLSIFLLLSLFLLFHPFFSQLSFVRPCEQVGAGAIIPLDPRRWLFGLGAGHEQLDQAL